MHWNDDTYFPFHLVSAIASLFPYLPVYMKMMGLTLTEAAVIFGTTTFFNGFTRTMFGYFADKLNVHKPSYIIMALLTVVFSCGMVFVPQRAIVETHNWNVDNQLHCGKNGVYVSVCAGRLLSSERNGDNHSYAAMTNLSMNAKDCRWTCSIEDQQNNPVKTMLSRLCNRTNNLTLNRTELFAFELNTLKPTSANNCLALASPISQQYSCQCYALDSSVVNDAECGDILCEEPTRLTCKTDCSDSGHLPFGNLDTHRNSRENVSSVRNTINFGLTFWGVAILYSVGQLVCQPLFGLLNAMTFTFLGDKRNKWGKQRMFGTIGAALVGSISGPLMDNYTLGQNRYAVAFFLFGFFLTLSAFSVSQFGTGDVKSRAPPNRLLKDLLGLLRNPEAIVLFSLITAFGVYYGVLITYLFWYLTMLGDAPQTLFGLCILCNSSVEILAMFFSDRIFRVVSQQNCFAIVCVGYAVRLAGYSFMTNPWMVLTIEPLHAVTFSLLLPTMMTYACRITPPGAHGSVQNIVSALYFSYGTYFGKQFDMYTCTYIYILLKLIFNRRFGRPLLIFRVFPHYSHYRPVSRKRHCNRE